MSLKEKVRLCDTCKDRVASHKCDCCNADMCNTCIADSKTIRVNTQDFGISLYCAECKKLYNKAARGDAEFFDKTFKSKISEEIKEYIKGRIFVDKL